MRESNEETIAQVLKYFIKVNNLSKGYYEAKIRAHWREISGSFMENNIPEMYILNNKLFLKVSSSPLRVELNMQKIELVARLNKVLGEDYLTEIVVR